MQIGDQVPDFTLPDQTGTERSLSELAADGPVVLFFYPAAMTKGCTIESCHFRDLQKEFDDAGATRVGISMDTVDKQAAFSDKHDFDYPLLADTDGKVATLFGVKRRIGALRTKRSTFVIDHDLIVRGVINSELSMNSHADKALEILASS